MSIVLLTSHSACVSEKWSTRLKFNRVNASSVIGIAALVLIWTANTCAQDATKPVEDATGRANSPFSRSESELPKGPATGSLRTLHRTSRSAISARIIRSTNCRSHLREKQRTNTTSSIRSILKPFASSVDCRATMRAVCPFSFFREKITPSFFTGTPLIG